MSFNIIISFRAAIIVYLKEKFDRHETIFKKMWNTWSLWLPRGCSLSLLSNSLLRKLARSYSVRSSEFPSHFFRAMPLKGCSLNASRLQSTTITLLLSLFRQDTSWKKQRRECPHLRKLLLNNTIQRLHTDTQAHRLQIRVNTKMTDK